MPSNIDGHSLLEREREVAELTAACRDAAAGRGRVIVVEGPAGIGKTALLDAGRRAAMDAGLTVLTGSGSQLERELAFGVVRQLFERPLRNLGDGARAEILAGAATLAVPILLEADPTPTADVLHAATHGLYWLAAELAADAPLMLVVDDAHWADAASLRWLAYLGRRLDGVALLVLVARRAGEPGADPELHDRVTGAAMAVVLRPAPLGEPAVARLLEAAYDRVVAPEFARACSDATGGNPFLLRELIASLHADGVGPGASGTDAVAAIAPAGVARAVCQRLAPLGPEALAVAEAAAVLSTDARIDRVATLAGVPLERTAELLDRLADAGILLGGDPIRFRHPILSSAVHAQTPVQRRGLAHLRAAELVLGEGAPPERVATHLLAGPAGGQAWVAETLRRAAGAAGARGAPDASVALLRRALAEGGPDRAAVLLELAEAEFTVQDPAAVEHARAAIDAAGTPDERVQAGLAAARALTSLARHEEATEALAMVEREAIALAPSARQAAQAQALMLTVWHRGPVAFGELLRGLRLEELPGSTPIERLMLATWAMQLMSEGRTREPMLGRARLVLARADPRDPADEHPILIMSRVLALADEVGEARAMFTAVIDGARARGAIATVATALAMRGEAGFRAGRLAEAEADSREAFALVTEHDIPVLIPAAVTSLVDVLVELEPAQRVLALLQRQFPSDVALPRGYSGMMVLFALGQAAAATGDATAAAIRFESCGLAQAEWGERNPAARPWRSSLALALATLGRDKDAARLVDEELRLARAFGATRAIGIALRARALLGSGEAQIMGLRDAAQVLSSSPAQLEYTRTLVDLGAALRRAGNRTEARGMLASALERCHDHRAAVLAERCRDELQAAGARPRRERLSGPESLTASERRVAALAAEGLTNRQIAQALFVTTKTVETHLGHVYPKLAINGRAELREALLQRA